MPNDRRPGNTPMKKGLANRQASSLLPLCMFVASWVLAGGNVAFARLSLVELVNEAMLGNTSILLQKEARSSSYAGLLDARAAFDPVVELGGGYSDNTYPTMAGPDQKAFQSSLSLSQQLPIGITITPAFSVQQTRSELTSGNSVSNVAKSGVTLGIPLFAGLGTSNPSAANRKAAEANYRAADLRYRFVVATGVYQTATAYWNYVYAYRLLKLNQELTRSADAQLKATKALSDADEIASQMVKQAQAYLDSARASEVTASLQLRQAWDTLMLTVGTEARNHQMLEEPSDSFPLPGAGFLHSLPAADQLATYAVAHRTDLESSRQEAQSTEQLLKGARNQMLPDIRLNLWAGYNGWGSGDGFSGYASSLTDHLPGPSISATVTYTLPIGNRKNQARYLQRLSDNLTAQVNRQDLERRVESATALSIASVRNAASVYELSRRSADAYRTLKEGELRKFRMGMSNIFNLQTSSNNLASAELQLLAAEKSFAQAVIDLRYASATLVESQGDAVEIKAADLTTLPAQGGPAR
mgnify:CR=1 FL=1